MGKMSNKDRKEVLRNTHNILTWLWILIMVLAAGKAIQNLIYYVDPVTRNEVLRNWSDFTPQVVVLFLVFLFTMVRFYHGDTRYLDRTYLEAQLAEFDPEVHSYFDRILDFYILVFHGIIFYAMASFEREFVGFVTVYVILLYFNVAWLAVLYYRQRARIRRGALGDDSRQAAMEVQRAAKWWIVNNMVCASLLVPLLFTTDCIKAPYSLTIFGIVAMANTIIDYLGTKYFYFPLARL
ncbi:MAG TPA: hypothetical protein G4N93_03000 [Dehalococcoidia bacterium]|nr:hypothetical protein [Dehalococcoidia bacterium]